MQVVKGNLFEAFRTGAVHAIAHCVNCQGVMGSGVALQVKNLYPTVYQEYVELLQEYKKVEESALGCCITSQVREGLVFNLFGQEDYGTNHRQLDYGAFADSLITIGLDLPEGSVVGMPYNIGCDRAGGDWEVVKELVSHFVEKEGIKVIFYQL